MDFMATIPEAVLDRIKDRRVRMAGFKASHMAGHGESFECPVPLEQALRYLEKYITAMWSARVYLDDDTFLELDPRTGFVRHAPVPPPPAPVPYDPDSPASRAYARRRADERAHKPIRRALRQRRAGNLEGAIATLVEAAGKALDSPDLACTLAKMLSETGKTEAAERWFLHAMKLAPDEWVVRMGYGTFLGESGRIAEARALLAGVHDEVGALLAAARPEEKDQLAGLQDFAVCTQINLARAAFETGDSAVARELAAPWLSHPEHGSGAHGVLADIVERDGLDPKQLAEEGLAAGQVSPLMVCHLLELAVAAEPCDFVALDGVLARADACFAFDWKQAEPELVAVLAQARQRFLRGVMLQVVEAATCPHLAALLATAA